MNMRDYLPLHLETQIKVKKQCFYCCSTFHSHSRVFNNEQNSYCKMNVKQSVACSWAVRFTSPLMRDCSEKSILGKQFKDSIYLSSLVKHSNQNSTAFIMMCSVKNFMQFFFVFFQQKKLIQYTVYWNVLLTSLRGLVSLVLYIVNVQVSITLTVVLARRKPQVLHHQVGVISPPLLGSLPRS
jgi:hypothetical protein